MDSVLKEIAASISQATWRADESPQTQAIAVEAEPHQPQVFRGEGRGWKFLLVTFSIEDQGFPPGSRGVDGTAQKDLMIVRLPRDLATRAMKEALAALPQA